ncbi:MAG: hypothetical protein EOO77_34910 [Oxalobacteraceae bacterium]|nr:MAG: hypothetical protein EOO77_34910 [Oxalobacteraceae bacterium]
MPEEKQPFCYRPIAAIRARRIVAQMFLYRSIHALIAFALLSACASTGRAVPPCWRAADLKQGEGFHGSVFIFAGYDKRPMIFPVGCDGGVTADLPEGVALPGYRGADFSVSPERLFYEAWVEGKVEGTAFGRPSVRLTRVVDPQQKAPRWLAGNVR